MDALIIGGIVFGCVFGGALGGMFLRGMLPEHHLNADSKDAIKVSTAMVATLAALVIGLLTASAKSSFDGKNTEMTQMVADIILLDRTLAEYGPETGEIRTQIRQVIATRLQAIWPDEGTEKVDPGAIGRGSGFEIIQRRLLDLAPQNDAQRWLKSTGLQITGQMAQTRWLAFQQTGSSIQWPFLAVLVFWLALIFASFGLFAPRNGSVIAALFACALSVSGALYLIIQMDQPYRGLIKISSAPVRAALNQLGRD
jgi:hypothetical protein